MSEKGNPNIKLFDHKQKQHRIASINKLLERVSDEEYIEEWTKLLAQQIEIPKETHEIAVVIFRIGHEWLALATKIFVEISENRPIHHIPHSKSPILIGLVNLKGQLQLCFALHQLLEIEFDKESALKKENRLLVIQNENDLWAFPVNEVFGIHYSDSILLENVPVTLSKSSTNYFKGLIKWKEYSVGYIDEELLIYSLKKELERQR